MSERFGNGYFALGLIFGISLTTLFFLASSSQGVDSQMDDVSNQEGENAAHAYEYGNEPNGWYWVGRLIAAEDTLAQWIMAFFTIAAVALVWQTLRVTQEMARETKNIGTKQEQIGMAQTRGVSETLCMRVSPCGFDGSFVEPFRV